MYASCPFHYDVIERKTVPQVQTITLSCSLGISQRYCPQQQVHNTLYTGSLKLFSNGTYARVNIGIRRLE